MSVWLATTTAASAPGAWPILAVTAGVAVVLGGIMLCRLHPFLALVLAALTVGVLTPSGAFPDARQGNRVVQTFEQTAVEFGKTAGNIGLVIALASIIGMCMVESGAAERIVRRLLDWFGEAGAATALMLSGFLLSIPVFFDTVFFLLLPIARMLALRTGRDFMLYVMALTGGAAVTHSMVPPTPGPLLVADALKLNLGFAMVAGLLAGILPAAAVLWMARAFNRRVPVPVRDVPGVTNAELQSIVRSSDAALPPFGLALLPVLLPTFLIGLASFHQAFAASPDAPLGQVLAVLGHKTAALLVATLVAMLLHWRHARQSLTEIQQKLGPAIETAGVIILITAAGGAFGGMIRHSGVGDTLSQLASGQVLHPVLLAWGITALVRIAQGSATVAMITGAALMQVVIGDGANLPCHVAYIYLAIGFGSIILSWMNDSGFWLVSRMCGFTERETLRTWTLLETGIALVGLAETLLFACLFPMKGA